MFDRTGSKLLARKAFALMFIAAVAACGAGGAEKGRDRPPPLAKAEPATSMRFADRIEAVGTARANEQVTVSAPVTERITRLNFDDGDFVQRGQIIAVLQQAQQGAQLRERRHACARPTSNCAASRRSRSAASPPAPITMRRSPPRRRRGRRPRRPAPIGERVIRAPFRAGCR